ncbi:MAG: SMC-Scp complex subunit ScpB [Pirellulales bacterium]
MTQGDSNHRPTEHDQDAKDTPEVDLDSIAKLYADDFDDFENSEEVSLEELSKTYAQVVSKSETTEARVTDEDTEIQIFDPMEEEETSNESHVPVSPIAIVEAVLMVGRPDGGAISATEIAALMRGVSEAEVDQLIEQLNVDYQTNQRALRVALVGGAYRLELADDLQPVKDRFLGPAREIKLNQAAIDCLALVAYQPGITREKLDEQRGQSSGAVLNQLVRRELLEMRREKEDKKLQPHYYPTNRMLGLVGLESLEDLPTVEDWNG